MRFMSVLADYKIYIQNDRRPGKHIDLNFQLADLLLVHERKIESRMPDSGWHINHKHGYEG